MHNMFIKKQILEFSLRIFIDFYNTCLLDFRCNNIFEQIILLLLLIFFNIDKIYKAVFKSKIIF